MCLLNSVVDICLFLICIETWIEAAHRVQYFSCLCCRQSFYLLMFLFLVLWVWPSHDMIASVMNCLFIIDMISLMTSGPMITKSWLCGIMRRIWLSILSPVGTYFGILINCVVVALFLSQIESRNRKQKHARPWLSSGPLSCYAKSRKPE